MGVQRARTQALARQYKLESQPNRSAPGVQALTGYLPQLLSQAHCELSRSRNATTDQEKRRAPRAVTVETPGGALGHYDSTNVIVTNLASHVKIRDITAPNRLADAGDFPL